MRARRFLRGASNLLGTTGEGLFAIGGNLAFVGGMGLLILGPYLVTRPILQWQAGLCTPVHATVLCFFFAVLLTWALLISGDRGADLFKRIYRNGIKWPFLFSISLLLFATLCFASLSGTLSDLGVVQFEPRLPRGEFWRLQDFYMWHFFNSIPELKIPDILLWPEPFKYKDHLSGALLLVFDVVVILPVIGSFKVSSRARKDAKRRQKTAAHGG